MTIANELYVKLRKEQHSCDLYDVYYGKEVIATRASYPSAEDVALILDQWRTRGDTQEDSAQLKRLSERGFRHGQFNDDAETA